MTHTEIKRFGNLVKAFAEIKHPLTDTLILSIANGVCEYSSLSELLDVYEQELNEFKIKTKSK